MFFCCTNLTKLTLHNNFIPDGKSIVTNNMFYNCKKLKKQNVNTNNKKIKDMLPAE